MNRAATMRACRPPQAQLYVVKPDRFLTDAARIKLFIHALSSTAWTETVLAVPGPRFSMIGMPPR